MSRKITIAVNLKDADAVEAALTELDARFERTKENYFKVSAGKVDYHDAEGEVYNFRYTGVTIDCATEQASFDEDCQRAKQFVDGPLRQAYSKCLFKQNMELDGDQILEEMVISDSMPFVEGFTGDLENGDIVIRSVKPFYGGATY